MFARGSRESREMNKPSANQPPPVRAKRWKERASAKHSRRSSVTSVSSPRIPRRASASSDSHAASEAFVSRARTLSDDVSSFRNSFVNETTSQDVSNHHGRGLATAVLEERTSQLNTLQNAENGVNHWLTCKGLLQIQLRVAQVTRTLKLMLRCHPCTTSPRVQRTRVFTEP